MLHAILLLVAAVLGVIGATSTACLIGLITGTETSCGLLIIWAVGLPVAIVFVVVLGIPALIIYRKLGLTKWWQFMLGGAFLALPFWFAVAEPFGSARWESAGFFDTLNYLGSGILGGLLYWWLAIKKVSQNAL